MTMTMTSSSFLTVILLTALSLASSILSNAQPTSALSRRATTCNGFSSLCNRQFSNVTFIGTHNSYAIGRGTSNVAANQEESITTQLNNGARMLQSQAHRSTNSTPTGAGIDLCHTSCEFFQGGTLEYWLDQVKSWSDSNPNEVLSLLIVNSDNLPATQFAQAFQSTGLTSKMWTPGSSRSTSNGIVRRDQWPTLGEMIDAGTPIVAWLSTTADVSSVPYLLPEFGSMWENPFDQLSTPFNCSVDRIASGQDPSNLMYLSNHFLYSGVEGVLVTPDVDALYTTNSLESVLADSQNCAAAHGTYPNFVLVDYYSIPENDVFAAAAQMNGVSFTNTSTGGGSGGGGGNSSNPSSGGSGSGATTLNNPTSLFLFFSLVTGLTFLLSTSI